MNTTPPTVPPASFAKIAFPSPANFFSGLLTVLMLLSLSVTRAESPDDKYLNIIGIIDQADSLNANGQTNLARAKYLQAQAALAAFKRDNATANPKAVAYRMNYLAEKISATSVKSQPADSGTATATQSSRPEKKAAAATATHQLKLLAAGAEPRKVLRLHPNAGDKQSLGLTTKMAMTMTMGDTPTPAMKLPATQMNLDVTVKEVAANGDILYETIISDASVVSDPEVMALVAETMKASLLKFKGVAGTGKLSDRGFGLGTEMKLPADADPQARQTLDQMKDTLSSTAAPLPEEAVGPGARWEVKAKLKSQGMTIDQTVTYELVSIEDGRITLKSTITQNAANQKIQSPAMPGMKLDLSKMTSTGTGSTTFDLAKLMPTEGNSEEHTEMVMEMNMGGQKQSMTTKTDVNVQMGAK